MSNYDATTVFKDTAIQMRPQSMRFSDGPHLEP